jgi:putative phosphotransacetylase
MENEEIIKKVVSEVVNKIVVEKVDSMTGQVKQSYDMIQVNASNRHVHLSRKDADILFGEGYEFKVMKDLSQPGQFACSETVTIVGPKGAITRVRILGPVRSSTQVEILASDQYTLGVKAPVRQSGKLDGSAPCTIVGPKGSVYIDEGVIIAQRHIHLDPDTAEKMGLKDGDTVSVDVKSERPITFRDVLVRVNKAYAPDMHIDIDEANSCLIKNGTLCKVIKE